MVIIIHIKLAVQVLHDFALGSTDDVLATPFVLLPTFAFLSFLSYYDLYYVAPPPGQFVSFPVSFAVKVGLLCYAAVDINISKTHLGCHHAIVKTL